VLDELLPRLPGLPDLDLASYPLPDGLSGLYHGFLNRELGRDEDRWYEMFKPVLGLIAVAQGEGLTKTQLQQITGKEVEQPLRICRQYLGGELPEGPFRVFHKSLADFLLEDEKNIHYHIDSQPTHQKIAEYYLRIYNGRWPACRDHYALCYTSTHLIEAVQGAKQRDLCQELTTDLFEILTDLSFLEANTSGAGIDVVCANLNKALKLVPSDGESASDLHDIVQILDREAYKLRDWNRERYPTFFATQVCYQARQLGCCALLMLHKPSWPIMGSHIWNYAGLQQRDRLL